MRLFSCFIISAIAGFLAISQPDPGFASGIDAPSLRKGGDHLLGGGHLFEGKRLHLNGRGVHEATIFKVDVYSASLFLENPSSDDEQILSSPQLKVVELEFHRAVSKDQVRNAWLADLSESCSGMCEATVSQAQKLLKALPDLSAGQKITYFFFRNRVEVQIDGRRMGELRGSETVRTVLSAFIGSKTPAIHIRAALLGEEHVLKIPSVSRISQ